MAEDLGRSKMRVSWWPSSNDPATCRSSEKELSIKRRSNYVHFRRKLLGTVHCYIDGRTDVQNGWDLRQWRLNATAPTLIQSSPLAAEYPKPWAFFPPPYGLLRFVHARLRSADIIPCTRRTASLFGNYMRLMPGKIAFTVKRFRCTQHTAYKAAPKNPRICQ
jgi:hypothetical protein